MSERNQQYLKVALFLFSIGVIGFAIYFFLFNKTPALVTPTPDTGAVAITDGRLTTSNPAVDQGTTVPQIPNAGTQPGASTVVSGGPVLVSRLTASKIVNPTLTSGKEITYYDPNDGLFYSIDVFGNALPISDARFLAAQSVNLSNDASSAVMEFPDGSNIIYNFDTGSQTTLPTHWQDFHFSDKGALLAGKNMATDPNSRSLVVTANDGSQATSIAALGENESKVTINWSPTNEIVAFSETGRAQSAFGRQEIYLIDKTGNAIGTIIVEGNSFSALWSPSGSHILYSVSDPTAGDRPALWFVKASGNEIGTGRLNLGIETWVEKCTFKDDTFVICAVPKVVTNSSGIDHSYITSGDDIYQVNVTTGRSVLLATPALETQMFNLRVSDDQSILYFTDQLDRLNSIRLR